MSDPRDDVRPNPVTLGCGAVAAVAVGVAIGGAVLGLVAAVAWTVFRWVAL